jgi:hypothetical protein
LAAVIYAVSIQAKLSHLPTASSTSTIRTSSSSKMSSSLSSLLISTNLTFNHMFSKPNIKSTLTPSKITIKMIDQSQNLLNIIHFKHKATHLLSHPVYITFYAISSHPKTFINEFEQIYR